MVRIGDLERWDPSCVYKSNLLLLLFNPLGCTLSLKGKQKLTEVELLVIDHGDMLFSSFMLPSLSFITYMLH